LEYDLNAAWQGKVNVDTHLHEIKATTVVELRNQAETEFNALWGLVPSQFEAIQLDEAQVVATTNRVVLPYRDRLYDLGRFLVSVPFDSNGRIRIDSLDQPCAEANYPHPHVGSDGTPCWGNLTSAIAESRAIGDVFHQVLLAERLLGSYNPASPYVEIERWDPEWIADDDHHDRCYEDADPYLDCANCGDDGCPHHEDRFDRCWQMLVDSSEDAPNEGYERCVSCSLCHYRHDAERILAMSEDESTTATEEMAR